MHSHEELFLLSLEVLLTDDLEGLLVCERLACQWVFVFCRSARDSTDERICFCLFAFGVQILRVVLLIFGKPELTAFLALAVLDDLLTGSKALSLAKQVINVVVFDL